MTRTAAAPGRCRFCHRPSWGTDSLGAVHDCCRAWQHVIAAGYRCPACQVAEIIARQPQTWPDGTLRPVRLPVLPPLPATLPDGTPYVPDPPPVPRCTECGQRMTVIVPGQRAHPLCAADWAIPLREAA